MVCGFSKSSAAFTIQSTPSQVVVNWNCGVCLSWTVLISLSTGSTDNTTTASLPATTSPEAVRIIVNSLLENGPISRSIVFPS